MKSKATGTASGVVSERKDGGELDAMARILGMDPGFIGETCDSLWRLGEKAADVDVEECAEDSQHLSPATWDEGYRNDRIPAELAILHSDVSAALEAFFMNDIEKFSEELAAAFIRVMTLAHRLGIDLGHQTFRRLAIVRSTEFRKLAHQRSLATRRGVMEVA